MTLTPVGVEREGRRGGEGDPQPTTGLGEGLHPASGDDSYWQNPVMGRKGRTLVSRPYWSLAEHNPGEHSLIMSTTGGSKGRAEGHEPTMLLTAGSPTRRREQCIPMAAVPTPLLHHYCPIVYDTKTVCNLSLNCQFRGAENQGSRETKRKRD